MFERLSDAFSSALRKVSGKSTITEANVRETLEDVRSALLDADVNYDVANAFVDAAFEDAQGRKVTQSLKPAEEMVGVVHDRLVALMGGQTEAAGLPTGGAPNVLMLCGLQGSGKTTTAGKLAAYLKKRGRSVMIAALDLQRPAAVDQLRIVAEQVRDESPGAARVLFYAEPDKCAEYGRAVGVAVDVCKRALAEAKKQGVDTLILDTAGRLHVNDDLMDELQRVHRTASPQETLLVLDAMTGQDAVSSAKSFHERLTLTGVVLSKFDSDTRGGAALSVRAVTGAPVRFLGVGEKLEALEEFHAERVAGRILGMGDVVSLVEKAREEVSEEEAEALAEKMAKGQFNMEDFLAQMRSLRRMGPLKQIMGLLPGVGSALKDVNVDESHLNRIEGIVNSMTPAERRDISLLNNSRRRRIAKGSASTPDEVAKLVKQFEAVAKFSKQMAGMGMFGQVKAMREMKSLAGADAAGLPGMGAGMPAGFPGFGTRKSTHTASPKAKYKKRKR
ncbi:MAG: signal recognition particle protein [Phycisphaerales bacterium]